MSGINAPIPGQSLTGTPKGNPWERPPEMNDPEEALLFHLENLSKPQVTEALMDALDVGMDILTLTEGILRSGVAAGRHSIDISLMIAPVIHEYIKGTADALNVPYEEGLENPEEKVQMKRAKKKVMTNRVEDKLVEMKEANQEIPEEEVQIEEPVSPAPQGAVQRPMRGGV